MNEIKIMKSINSEYCLEIIEIHETEKSIYFVMDILYGGELL